MNGPPWRRDTVRQWLSERWDELPREVRRIVIFIAIAGLAPWLTVTSGDIRNYVVGVEQILAGQSVYAPQMVSPFTGEVGPKYPYLPSFAILLALAVAPLFVLVEADLLPRIVFDVGARVVANAPGYLALVGIPLVTYELWSQSERPVGQDDEVATDAAVWGVLAVTLTPALWFQVLESGTDTFVALLTLLAVYAVLQDHWTLAGLLVGTATFKFTGLPLAFVLATYSLSKGSRQFRDVAIGGIASQLPNLAYFALYVEDLLFVIEKRGAMSLIEGETRAVATAPFRLMGLEQWYIETGFFLAFFLFVALGTAVALRGDDLVLGFAVSYLATSYFAPVGEVNEQVLVILLLIVGAVNFSRKRVRYLVGWLLVVELYRFLLRFHQLEYVSAPFSWLITGSALLEFVTIVGVLVGMILLSDTKPFHPH